MSKKLSKYEQETIINYNRAEDMANIFTYDMLLQRHIEKKLGINPISDNGFGGRDYKVPKDFIRRPSPPRRLSAETRAKLALRAKYMNRHPVLVKNLQ